MRSRIAIDKNQIPYQFQIMLGGRRYGMEWQYNARSGCFTCTLSDAEGNVLVYGEPLVYGNPLFAALTRGTQLPPVDLVPLDESGGETAVTWDNLGETVFLTLDDEGGAA